MCRTHAKIATRMLGQAERNATTLEAAAVWGLQQEDLVACTSRKATHGHDEGGSVRREQEALEVADDRRERVCALHILQQQIPVATSGSPLAKAPAQEPWRGLASEPQLISTQ